MEHSPSPVPRRGIRRRCHGAESIVGQPCMTIRLAILLACVAAGSLLIGDGFLGPANALIVTQIRLPRTLLAVLIGGALGLSGAVLQGALRNPLADPGLLGIPPAAGLGAMIAFYWGLGGRFAPALPVGGLIGAG